MTLEEREGIVQGVDYKAYNIFRIFGKFTTGFMVLTTPKMVDVVERLYKNRRNPISRLGKYYIIFYFLGKNVKR